MKARAYTLVGSQKFLQRVRKEYTMLGFYSFWRGPDLVISPWPEPKKEVDPEDAKRTKFKKRERDFGYTRN